MLGGWLFPSPRISHPHVRKLNIQTVLLFLQSFTPWMSRRLPTLVPLRIQPLSTAESSTNMLPLELTLVLAATRDMGIGLNGTLPWSGLKKEMAYFARVTKRLPAQVSSAPPCAPGSYPYTLTHH